jgi:peptidoglycan/LPS O-acetylase OafA/YrhL
MAALRSTKEGVMPEIDRTYVAIALLWAVIGMLLGLYMGIAADNKLLVTHVAIMLNGFVTLAIYGMLYRLWPALKKSTLARIQFWVAVISVAGIVVGSYFYATNGSVPLVASASIIFIVSAAMMAWLFIAQGGEA